LQEDAHTVKASDYKYCGYQEKNDFPEIHAEPLSRQRTLDATARKGGHENPE